MRFHRTPFVLFLLVADKMILYAKKDKNVNESDDFGSISPPPQSNTRFKGVYAFPVRKIKKMHCLNVEAAAVIKQRIPVVLKGCTFARSALKWNIIYLQKNMRDGGHPVLISPSRRFPYYNVEKIKGEYNQWRPPVGYQQTTVEQFVEIIKEMENENNDSHAYFQSLLYLNEHVGKQIYDDVMSFNFTWLLSMAKNMDWKREMSNLLLIGMKNVVTPAHFDLLENIYLQIQGEKRWILFSPDSYPQLYPFPVDHPHDRQSQVNFDYPDYNTFPEFRNVRGQEVVLEAGDVLYIPIYWWHYVETSMEGPSVSLNFWFEPNKLNYATSPSESKKNKH